MKKKIVYLFSILFVFMLLICNKSEAIVEYAETLKVEVEGISYEIPKAIGMTDFTDFVVIALSVSDLEAEKISKERCFYVFCYNSPEIDAVHSCDTRGDFLRLYKKGSNEQADNTNSYRYYGYDINGKFSNNGDISSSVGERYNFLVYSSANVYNAKNTTDTSHSGANYDDIFFDQPPTVEAPKTLAEAIQGMKTEKISETIVKIILVVAGLIILLVGLRKSLTTLVRGLKS